jgi:hypothetical protein
MGLFGSRKGFAAIPTAEERYAAEVKAALATSDERTEVARRDAVAHAEQWREQTAVRRQQVVQAGGMHLRNGTVVLDDRWQLATDKVPTGNLKGKEFRGKVGDLTVKDLHALAKNHGPNCRCRLSR